MSRYNATKQSVIIAVLVILLCLIALTGATLALFTNNPNDGKIGIVTTAGDVAVDIVTDTEAEDSLVGDVLDFMVSATQQEATFEPGAVFYTQGFKIKNTGNIPVNFRLYISEDSSIDMAEFCEAFEFWITTDPSSREHTERLITFSDELGVGETSDTFYLVIKMKETAGNEFQNKTYSGIGVTVYAVQANVDIKE